MITDKTRANILTSTRTMPSFCWRSESSYTFKDGLYPVLFFLRMREADKKTVFAVLKKSERDKKKLLETVLKQLRQLALAPLQS